MTTFKFGNPETGVLSDFLGQFHDTTAGGSTQVSMLTTPLNATGWKARIQANDSIQFYGDTQHVRVHLISPATPQSFFALGKECWLARSMVIPSGFGNTFPVHAGDEEHGGNSAQGPAPLNVSYERGDYWRIFIRGGPTNLSSDAIQWMFGQTEGHVPPRYHEYEQDWVGGNKLVVLDEKIDFLVGIFFDATGNGWVEIWARWGGATTYTNVVPRKTGLYTSYPDFGGPFLSLYYDVGGGSTNAFDVLGGYWGDSKTAVQTALDSQLGVTSGGGGGGGGGGSTGTVSLAQSAIAFDNTGSAVTTVSQPVTFSGGSAVYVIVGWVNPTSENATSVADTLGNTYTLQATNPAWDTGAGYGYKCYLAKNVAGGTGTLTLTTPSGGRAYPVMQVFELAGAHPTSPLDQVAFTAVGAFSNGANSMTSPSVTTTSDGQVVLGHLLGSQVAWTGLTVAGGTGFTLDYASLFGEGAAHTSQAAAGAITSKFTLSGVAGQTGWTGAATFKPGTVTGGGGGGTSSLTAKSQNDKTTAGTTSTWTVGPFTVNSADSIWVAIYHNDSGVNSINTPTDNLSNTYTLIDTVTDSSNSAMISIYYAKNSSAGSCTITETFGAAVNFPGMVAHSFSADTTAPLDKHAISAALAGGTGTDHMTSGAQTTTAKDYVVSWSIQVAGSPNTPTHGTGYTLEASDTTFGSLTEDLVQSVAGSVAGTWTLSSASGTYYVAMAAFKPPASAAGKAPPIVNPKQRRRRRPAPKARR